MIPEKKPIPLTMTFLSCALLFTVAFSPSICGTAAANSELCSDIGERGEVVAGLSTGQEISRFC